MIKRIFVLFFVPLLVLWLMPSAHAEQGAYFGAPISLSAQSAVLIDAFSGEILFEKNAHAKMGMASTTKIMTALIVSERCSLDETVSVSPQAVGIEGSSVYLCEGERLSVRELLYAIMLASANDAATALAIHVAGSTEGFCALMNAKARELGLYDTHFTNPHGLYDGEHYTTAYELALISMEALKNDALREISSTYKKVISSKGGKERVLVNHNKMLRLYDGAIGLKTGFTKKTGRTLVSAAEREGLRLIAVTLNAPSDWNDHTLMLDYGYSNYVRTTLYRAGEFRYALSISGGCEEYVYLTNAQDILLTLKKDRGAESYTVETCSRFICAPIEAKTAIGRVIFECDGRYAVSPLVAERGVDAKKEKGFFERLFDK